MDTLSIGSSSSRLRLPQFHSSSPTSVASTGDVPRRRTLTGSCANSPVVGADSCCSKGPRSGHIRVAVRVRPVPPEEDSIIEVAGTGAIAIRKLAATGGNEFLKSQQGHVEERWFDRVYGPHATQKQVFSQTCQPIINEAVEDGRNATIFVYGATGAGKTHTMFGEDKAADGKDQGIIFRGVREAFDALNSLIAREQAERATRIKEGVADEDEEMQFEVKVSFLELYNENVSDLLQADGGGGTCRVLEDCKRGVVKITNLSELPVRTAEQALGYLASGMRARTIEATAANLQSSRAHAVYSLMIERVGQEKRRGKGAFGWGTTQVRQMHSKICFIDLAGSERAKDTLNSGSALKDGARINQSLLALANCIDAMAAKTKSQQTLRKKAPFRDSKLTLMLKSSLTGDGLVAMIGNVHPGRAHFEDSNNTLEYAKRASTVRQPNGPNRRHSFAFSPTSPALPSAGHTKDIQLCPPLPNDEVELQVDRCTPSSSTLPAPGKHRSMSDEVYGEESADFMADDAGAFVDTTASNSAAPSAPVSQEVTPPDSEFEERPTNDDCLSELSIEFPHASVEHEGTLLANSIADKRLAFEDAPTSADQDCTTMDKTGNERIDDKQLVVGDLLMCDRAHIDLTAATSSQAEEEELLAQSDDAACASATNPPATDASVSAIAQADKTNLPVPIADIFATMQKEKQVLLQRLESVIRERDAMRSEVVDLGNQNQALIAANLKKDEQIAELIVRTTC